ncbi:MAG TPA: hypothetical protein VF054_00650 [Micromonosporaceae bacterium]
MTRRVVIALLTPPVWVPPGVDPHAWRLALAEDVVDLLATLAQVDAAVAVPVDEREIADAVRWPSTTVYPLASATPGAALAAAALDGYEQAAVLASDAPDLPAMMIGKLLRPLSTRAAAAAAATGGGLVGVACRLPVPDWLATVDLDVSTVTELSAAAPRRGSVAAAPGWHRLRGAEDLSSLDPAVEGWDATRALLTRGQLALG